MVSIAVIVFPCTSVGAADRTATIFAEFTVQAEAPGHSAKNTLPIFADPDATVPAVMTVIAIFKGAGTCRVVMTGAAFPSHVSVRVSSLHSASLPAVLSPV